MPKFTYIGQSKDGSEVKKTVQAEDRYAVYDIARKEGHTVTVIDAEGSFSLKKYFNVGKIEQLISHISTDDLVMVTRNLGSMLEAGLPLSRALSVLQRQSKNPKLKAVIADILERINKGDQFNSALAAHNKVFNDLYVAMVAAGEESGSLAESLKTLSVQMERSSNLRKKIKGAMMYPTIVLIIMVIIGILMMIYVMPSITDTFKGLNIDLPTTTKALIASSDFMVAHTVLVLLGIVLFVGGFIQGLRTKLGKRIFSWIVVRLPVIGNIAKEANAASTARTLASLLTSGVDVIRSLKITEDVVQNVYYKEILHEAARRVEKGTALSETFIEREDLYPILVGEMIAVGEETGQIAQMLEQLAIFYENEVEHKTKDLSTIIEPILMVVIGGTVGFFALAMIAPIYSIGDSL